MTATMKMVDDAGLPGRWGSDLARIASLQPGWSFDGEGHLPNERVMRIIIAFIKSKERQIHQIHTSITPMSQGGITISWMASLSGDFWAVSLNNDGVARMHAADRDGVSTREEFDSTGMDDDEVVEVFNLFISSRTHEG